MDALSSTNERHCCSPSDVEIKNDCNDGSENSHNIEIQHSNVQWQASNMYDRVRNVPNIESSLSLNRAIWLQGTGLMSSGHVGVSISWWRILLETTLLKYCGNKNSPISICVQVILNFRPSRAVAFVRPSTACFVAVYPVACGRGECAAIEPLLMMRPPGGDWALNTLKASRVQRKGPIRFTLTMF